MIIRAVWSHFRDGEKITLKILMKRGCSEVYYRKKGTHEDAGQLLLKDVDYIKVS